MPISQAMERRFFNFIFVFAFCGCLLGVPQSSWSKPALVIIDMQPGFVEWARVNDRKQMRRQVSSLLNAQVEAIASAKRSRIPIVVVQYPGRGKTYPQLMQMLEGYGDLRFFEKTSNGIFENGNIFRKQLLHFLRKNQVSHLIMTGVNGGACVEKSIEGALENDFHVTAISKAIADLNDGVIRYPYDNRYRHFHQREGAATMFEEKLNVHEVFTSDGMSVNPELAGEITPPICSPRGFTGWFRSVFLAKP